MTPRFIARQFSHPSGFSGRLIGNLMNRRNAAMNLFCVQQLNVETSDRVLEIGFGGGVTLPALIEHAAFVCGIDRSSDVVKRADSTFSRAVSRGRALFQQGSVEALPLRPHSFNKVCSVNTIYFWRSLDSGFAEIHRVLAPQGRLVIGFLPKQHMDKMQLPADIFTPRTTGEVTTALEKAGFHEVRVVSPQATTAWNAVVANR